MKRSIFISRFHANLFSATFPVEQSKRYYPTGTCEKYDQGDDSYFQHALRQNGKLHRSLAEEGEQRSAMRSLLHNN